MGNLMPIVFIHAVRQDIERCDTTKILERLQMFRDLPVRYHGCIHIIFNGYDNDIRELFEIPEAVAFYKKLDQDFPYLPVFLSKETIGGGYNQFGLYLSMVLTPKIVVEKIKSIGLRLSVAEVLGLLAQRIVDAGILFSQLNIPEKDVEEILNTISNMPNVLFDL